MSDLLAQNLSTYQTDKQPDPPTIASAATLAPQTKFSFVSGTVQIETITPPTSGYSEITLCFTNGAPGLFLTTGNLKTAYQPIQNRPIDLCYIKAENKWYVKAVV